MVHCNLFFLFQNGLSSLKFETMMNLGSVSLMNFNMSFQQIICSTTVLFERDYPLIVFITSAHSNWGRLDCISPLLGEQDSFVLVCSDLIAFVVFATPNLVVWAINSPFLISLWFIPVDIESAFLFLSVKRGLYLTNGDHWN